MQWGKTTKDLSWIGIHPVLNISNPRIVHTAEIGSFGQKPSNNAVVVLTGLPLRRTIGMSKIERCPCVVREDRMLKLLDKGEFNTVIECLLTDP